MGSGERSTKNTLLRYSQAHHRRAIKPLKIHLKKPRGTQGHGCREGIQIKDSEESQFLPVRPMILA